MWDGNPPLKVDALWFIAASIANVERRVSRAAADGTLEPVWAVRVRDALDHATALCDAARVAGAVLPVRPEPVGASVAASEPAAEMLPTEAAHARDDATWAGL